MKKTPWYHPSQVPARRGYYERDHRQCPYPGLADRCITRDLWEPVPDPEDILYPGVWYVVCESYLYVNPLTGRRQWMESPLNDATHQNLPWRGMVQEARNA